MHLYLEYVQNISTEVSEASSEAGVRIGKSIMVLNLHYIITKIKMLLREVKLWIFTEI